MARWQHPFFLTLPPFDLRGESQCSSSRNRRSCPHCARQTQRTEPRPAGAGWPCCARRHPWVPMVSNLAGGRADRSKARLSSTLRNTPKSCAVQHSARQLERPPAASHSLNPQPVPILLRSSLPLQRRHKGVYLLLGEARASAHGSWWGWGSHSDGQVHARWSNKGHGDTDELSLAKYGGSLSMEHRLAGSHTLDSLLGLSARSGGPPRAGFSE